MLIADPTAEERALLKKDHAHRFPELRYLLMPGDGAKIRLPVVLGNPSGACKMPEGRKPRGAWKKSVAATFGRETDFDFSALVTDCVLWPTQSVFAQWCERWPALMDAIRSPLRAKYGGAQSLVSEPGREEEHAPEIEAALEANPSATWMRFSPKGAVIDVVVKAPASHVWSLFVEAMRAADADAWALVLDLTVSSVVASTAPIDTTLARWPGLALLVGREVGYLAGMVAEVVEGEL